MFACRWVGSYNKVDFAHLHNLLVDWAMAIGHWAHPSKVTRTLTRLLGMMQSSHRGLREVKGSRRDSS